MLLPSPLPQARPFNLGLALVTARWRTAAATAIAVLAGFIGPAPLARADLAQDFATPPDSAKPWVVAYWLEGNVTREGITADLEAMKAAGIAGYSFMDCALGNPNGPHRFMSDSWREMFRFMLAESHRLGLQVDLNDGPGWAGSGGPWIKPEQAAQKVIVSETLLEGPAHFSGKLAPPAGVAQNFYRDIATLAYPAPASTPAYRIPAFDSTKSFAGGHDFAGVVPWPRFVATSAAWPALAPGQAVRSGAMVELTAKVGADGTLEWDVPAGHWIVLRFGHTASNGAIRAGQAEAQGLECDKLSPAGIDAQFAGMVGRLQRDLGDVAPALVSTHIDSWESGSGNWTGDFRAQFQRRRGYDLLRFLPTLDGIAVDSLAVSERFLWDFRQTISELVLENYAGRLGTLAHQHGLRLSIEGYDGTVDDMSYAGRADEPMAEFWQRPIYSRAPMTDLVDETVSAAHAYGRNVVGAEAFTAIRGDFLDHPATLKPLADWAFCAGINRVYLSQWVFQPWPRLAPGVSFDEFGTVFHRSQTWWDIAAKPWHDYLARCQLLLRQGHFVADICYLQAEGAPARFAAPIPASQHSWIPDRPAYNYDGCPPEIILDRRTTVEEGHLHLPSGMKYAVLVLPTYDAGGAPVAHLMEGDDYYYKAAPLPRVQTMTPALLRRVKELVEAGATVLGPRPLASPSLSGFPDCDQELARLADDLWGPDQGTTGSGEHRLGRGRVVWGRTPDEILRGQQVAPDFTGDGALAEKLNYTHRHLDDDTDLYFVVNKAETPVQGSAHFRVAGRSPEFWWPQTGTTSPGLFAREQAGTGTTDVPLSLHAHESVFVVFRKTAPTSTTASASTNTQLVSLTQNGTPLWPAADSATANSPRPADNFTLAAWVKPRGEIPLPVSTDGGWKYARTGLTAPGAGYQTYCTEGEGRRGFVVGANGVVVYQYGDSGEVQPLLAYDHSMMPGNRPAAGFGNGISDDDVPAVLVGVIYAGGIPKLYLDGKLVATGPANRFPDRIPVRWADTRPHIVDLAALESFEEKLHAAAAGSPNSPDAPGAPVDFTRGEIFRSGRYVPGILTAAASREIAVTLPAEQPLTGPWTVQFDPHRGGPTEVTFDSLADWSQRPELPLKYYSGTATYRTRFTLPADARNLAGRTVYLDLGDVAVAAAVRLNGQPVGSAWSAPYRVELTSALRSDGPNVLEIDVANLWVNRLIGDQHLPDDGEYGPSGALKAWPDWVLAGRSSPTGRYAFATRRLWKKDDPLVKSGLLGPVRLIFGQKLSPGR